MAGLKGRVSPATAVIVALLLQLNVILAKGSGGDGGGHISRRAVPTTAGSLTPLGDYWSMATVAANALSPLNPLAAKVTNEPLAPVFNNADFNPLFQELPKLMGELNQLTPEEQANVLFLFKVYVSLPSNVSPFFHQAVAQMTTAAPALHDLTKFNIATELSTYVQSIVDPIPNKFSTIASYMPKLQRRALLKAPSLSTIMGVVGDILLKNIGVPPPLIPFNILQQLLTMLVKAYIEGQLPGLPKLPGVGNVLSTVAKSPLRKLKKPKKPKIGR